MHKNRLSSLAILCSSMLFASDSFAQGQEIPQPTAYDSFQSLKGNPHFKRDPQNARVLLPANNATHRIDRSYLEMMARPKIPAATFDMLAAAGAEEPTVSIPDPGTFIPGLGTITELRGNILVIEGGANTVTNTQQGPSFNHQGGGSQEVINQVFQRLGDNYDFITVMTTFQDPGVAGYYFPLQQTTTGLGECNPQTGATFGCIFNQFGQPARLQGFVFMNSIDYWRNWDRQYDGVVHDLSDFNASVFAVMGQEIGHRWGAGMRFVDESGAISKDLLGRDESHWAAYMDSDASVHDGWDWEADSDSRFTLVDDMQRFSTLDLYAMGALPVGAAKPFFYIDNARFVANPFVGAQPIPAAAGLQLGYSVDLLRDNNIVLEATGELVNVTVQDVVNAEGSRCPDADSTQRAFKQLIVLVTRPGQSVNQVQSFLDELELMTATWEEWWSDRTDNALTLCTDAVGECQHASATLGKAEVNEGETINPGDSFELKIDVTGNGAPVKNAKVRIALFSKGAESTTIDLDDPVVSVGDLEPGETKTISVPLTLDEDYPCSASLTVEAKLSGDNAQTSSEDYSIFPGTRVIYNFSFDENDDDFSTNDDGFDEVRSGAMEYVNVGLTCFMSPRTPERDATPGGDGAWVTGDDGDSLEELDGSTSLWTGKIPLANKDVVNPLVRFKYWLDFPEGESGLLKILVSTDGEKFIRAKEFEESFHGWGGGFVRVLDVLDEVPDNLYVTFIFEGKDLEGGIDDVRVLDDDGICNVSGGCSCDAAHSPAERSAPVGIALMFGLGLALIRKRK